MKFEEMKYERPDVDAVLKELDEIDERLKNASDYTEFKNAFIDLDNLNRHVSTMSNICYIRHTIDTRNEFYTKETEFIDEKRPVLDSRLNHINKTILDSPFAEELKKDIPEIWFEKADFQQRSMCDEIIEDLQEEAKYETAYQALIASAEVPFRGEVLNLAGLMKDMQNEDPAIRKEATEAYWGWFEENEEKIGEIYDKLVKIRTRMAQKMGFENYIPLGYLRMQRLDYNQNDVEQYRKNVLEDVVPVASMLYEKQGKALGYPDMHIPVWDEKVEFLSGMPKPDKDTAGLVEAALNMYKELSPETGEYFQFMVDNELMDLDSKPGKAAGGYCTGIPDYKSPFIFANNNGTNQDAETMTHEAGHAFQCYMSKDIVPMSCMWPTMESAEIHSMSMEFFTWPWMESFFGKDTDKYYFAHLGGTVKFIPYGVLVDHFQHEVYAHPEWSHKERMACWRKLEKEYLPHKNYEGIDVLERGGWWMRQLHIFMDPFYYIDYTLAQVCAQQFWKRLQDKDPKAFEDYLTICKAGGTLPFRQIVKKAGLKVPFEPGCLKETMQSISEWFEGKNNEDY